MQDLLRSRVFHESEGLGRVENFCCRIPMETTSQFTPPIFAKSSVRQKQSRIALWDQAVLHRALSEVEVRVRLGPQIVAKDMVDMTTVFLRTV